MGICRNVKTEEKKLQSKGGALFVYGVRIPGSAIDHAVVAGINTMALISNGVSLVIYFNGYFSRFKTCVLFGITTDTGIPSGIQQLQRIGVGQVLSAVSMAVAAAVESYRKSVSSKHNMVDSASPLPMSMFWLGCQFVISAMAQIFTLVGLMNFFYAESTSGLKSQSMAISWSSLAFGYFTSSVVVSVINKVSGGWLANNNLNRDKLDYFYCLLAGVKCAELWFLLTMRFLVQV
ncbi:hypothetical protein RDI58_011910 [Solanum bulbocastanum]|uniref:Uncharacterized protein n=1 Tax=Solanum bulbocastanum TaxID=147425 RepID=A0AAN8TTM5_SOLBU